MTIERGTWLEVRTAGGGTERMRALGAPTSGRDFPVVWVCTPAEYEEASTSGKVTKGIPWPLDAVAVGASQAA
jgi:hypothetical protein